MQTLLRRATGICSFLLCPALTVSAQKAEDPVWNVVAAIPIPDKRQIDLRTAAPKGSRDPRVISLPRELDRGVRNTPPESIQLSRTGSKMVIHDRLEGRVYLGDLTGPIPVWDRCHQFHMLPGRQYVLTLPEEILVFGDRAVAFGCKPEPMLRAPLAPRLPSEATTPWISVQELRDQKDGPDKLHIRAPSAKWAAIDASGDVMYLDSEGKLHRYVDGKDEDKLVSDDLKGARPIAAMRDPFGEGNGFRVIMEQSGSYSVHAIGPCATQVSAALASGTHLFNVRLQALTVPGRPAETKDKERRTNWGAEGNDTWLLFPVTPDAQLYAPVLEMDESEQIYPSKIGIWANHDSSYGHDAKAQKEILGWYQQLPEKQKETALYYEIHSKPGTWLIEYWAYYVLDLRGVGGHVHDSEHTFIEVDKLGGQPVSILSAAHNSWNPGNMYTSFEGADRPQLPLFLFVESGKHAMAPDVNRDGVVTFGRDVNAYRDRAYLWGIRDYTGTTDAHMSSWAGDMAVPRGRRYWVMPSQSKSYFAHRKELEPDQPRYTYKLAKFAEMTKELENNKGREYAREAAGELETHADHRQPENIYKSRVFADTVIRLGGGYNFLDRIPLVSASVVTTLMKPFGLRSPLPLPGRIGIEYLTGPNFTRDISFSVLRPDGTLEVRTATFDFRRPQFVGGVYEKLMTNLFGFQAGFHRLLRRVTPPKGYERVPVTVVNSPWYFRVGLMAAIERLTIQAGPVWTNDNNRGLGFEIRGSVDVLSWKGRRKFGIPSRNGPLSGVPFGWLARLLH